MMAKITVSPADTRDTYDTPEYWKPIPSANVSLPNFTLPFAFGQRATDYALNGVLIVVLITVMISLGCTMEISKIKAHFWKPKGVAIAVVAQYGIMPLTAFALGKLLQLDPIEAVAVLICGCCPGGNLSNIFSLAAKGDMNLSIVMTTCSTLLALGLMPLLLYLYTKGLHHGHLETKVPYKGIVISLVMTLIPCALGIFLNEKKPQCARLLLKAGMIVLLLSSVPIIALSVINAGTSILIIFSPRLLGTSALMPFIGFSLGYMLSAFFSLSDQPNFSIETTLVLRLMTFAVRSLGEYDPLIHLDFQVFSAPSFMQMPDYFLGRYRRTICMETGCQNVQLCSTILKLAFAPDVIGPLFFFPLLYIIFQLGEGLLLVVIFRSYRNIKQWKDSAAVDNTKVENNQAAES